MSYDSINDPGKGQTISPETAVVRITALDPTIAMRAHLWRHWAKIALRQEVRAWDARRRGQEEAAFAPFIALETEETIEAVAAARHCIHNLWRVWREALDLAKEKDVDVHYITTDAALLEDPVAWSLRVTGLIGDRDEAVHHDEEARPTRPHPGYDTNVSGVAATFTAERASEAMDVLLDDVLRPALNAPSSAIQEFAKMHGHVIKHLDQQRATGEDLW